MLTSTLTLVLLALTLLQQAYSHGLLTDPSQRGALTPKNKFNTNGTFPNAPADQKAHFPAGDKSSEPGAAVRSQIAQAGPAGWSPFNPTDPSFKWRAGVCGDQIGKPQEHMRGGIYYYNAQIVRTYTQGSVIQVEINIVAHHNGFVQLHICDVSKCGGEISEDCFKQGHCKKLLRAPNGSCDSGFDLRCAPIDPANPGRWYLPCTTVPENTQERFGREKMLYQLPKSLTCDHCVVHWFWTAANTCNPPGVIDFYEGPFGPKNWGDCFGQAGAKGGYTKVQKDCSKDRFPEEYYQCADVAILPLKKPDGSVPSPLVPVVTVPESPKTVPPPMSPVPAVSISSSPIPTHVPKASLTPRMSLFKEFLLVADGKVIQSLPERCIVDIRKFNRIAIEAVTFDEVATFVEFFVNGKREWTDYKRPYFFFGNRRRVPNYWPNPVVNRLFKLRVEADGDFMESMIYFIK